MTILQRPQTLIERASSFLRQNETLEAAEHGDSFVVHRGSLANRAAAFFEDKYTRGEFADPASVRAYPLGPKIITPGEKMLVKRLREECQFLGRQVLVCQEKQSSAEARSKALAEGFKKTDSLIGELRESSQRHADEASLLKIELRKKNDEITKLNTEIADTHAGLADLDSSISAVRAKRRSWLPLKPEGMEVFGVPLLAPQSTRKKSS